MELTTKKEEMTFVERFDADEKLTAKGKVLTTISIILIAINVTGAVMKEANTFLFKIEFAHQEGITYLLLAAILYLTVRYRNYAQPYHHELFLLWSERMMQDKEIFNYNPRDEVVTGFLGDAFDVWGGDEPGIQDSKYHVSGFLRRAVRFPSVFRGESGDGEWFEEYFDEYSSLLSFNKKWTFSKYIRLLLIEFKYRFNAFINHREHLDILSPYMFAFIAVLSVIVPWETFT